MLGDLDAYTFTANTGDVVNVKMGRASGSLNPMIRLYESGNPVPLCTAGAGCTGTVAEIAGCLLPNGGTYTIVASDDYACGWSNSGDYNLELECLKPGVRSISPNRGGNNGNVTATITTIKLDLQGTVIVKLVRQGEADIVGQDPVVDSPNIITRFDLRGRTAGVWDLVVVDSAGLEVSLPEAFTVEEGGSAWLWVDIVGRDQIRIGREQVYHIRYGNSGVVDAYDVLLLVTVPARCEVYVDFPHPEDNNIDWASIPSSVKVESEKVIPLWLLRLGAKSADEFALTVKLLEGNVNEQVPIKVELKQAISRFASSGDIDDVEDSPIFIALVESITEILQTDNGLMRMVSQTVSEGEVRSTLSAGLRLWWDNFAPRGAVVGAGVGSLIGLAFGQPLLGFEIGITLGALADSAMFMWNLKMAELGFINRMLDSSLSAFNSTIVGSYDPNEKVGPIGFGEQHFVHGEEDSPVHGF